MIVDKNIFRQILKAIHPYKVYDKIRLGRNSDGGYVLSRQVLDHSNVIISLGINNEWSFEESSMEYKKFYLVMIDDQMSEGTLIKHVLRNLLTCLYRPLNTEVRDNFQRVLNTLTSYKKLQKKGKIIYKKLRIGNTQGEVNVGDLLAKYKLENRADLLFKIDIEGSEYTIVESLLKFEKQIVGLVIEFHNILKNPEVFLNCITLLNDFYSIYHIHYNNYTVKNEFISDAIEVSFANKTKYSLFTKDDESYPIKNLDFPCDTNKEEYRITNFL